MAQIRLAARLNQIISRPPATVPGMYRAWWIILGVLCLGLLAAGLYLAPEPAILGLFLLGFGVPMAFLLWHRPEFGLLAIIFLTSSLVPSDLVDLRLPIGGGLDLRDLVLVGMLGLLILRGLSRKNLSIPWRGVGAPLLIFLGFALFSALYALVYQNVESNWVLSDLRSLVFYCVFFVTGWAITRRRQLVIVLVGLFILADLLAIVIILQQFLGANSPLFTAMSYSNWRLYAMQQTAGEEGFGTVRIMAPGIALVYFMMIMAFCLMVFNSHSRRLRTIFALQFVFLNFSLLLTYTRALWIAAVVALGLVLIALIPTYKAHLMRYLVIGIPVFWLVFALWSMKLQQSMTDSALVTTSLDRILSILRPEETLQSYSLQWRIFETEEGLRSMSEYPLLGVGLGNSYRKVTTFHGEDLGWVTDGNLAAGEISRFTRFLHNSYLSIAVKMGLPALASFLWFCIALVANSVKLYRHQSEGLHRSIALSVFASFVALMLWSFFHQHFIQTEGTAIVGLMAGLAASLYHGVDSQNGLEQPSNRVFARLHS